MTDKDLQNISSFFKTQFAKIEDKETALNFAKEGAVAGLIYCLMGIGGVIFAYFGKDPVTGHDIDQDAFNNFLWGIIIQTPILLFLCWRVKVGKGYISAGLLLCFFLFEIITKFTNGTAAVWWIPFYFFIAAGLINGTRACWYLRKIKKQNYL